jgi:hypothetical protein
MRGDAAQRANFYQAALGGARGETAYMTRNEVRELEDLNPIDGGDKLLVPVVTPPPTPPAASDNPAVAKALELVALALKFNPNHDDLGRFAPGDGGGEGHAPGVHGTGAQATAVKKAWVATSPLKTVDEIYKGVPANKAALDHVGALVANETQTEYHAGPIKKVDRVMEKVAAGKPINGVNDIVRSTFYARSPKDADAIVHAIAKHFPVADEGYKMTEAGYFDRSMNVRFKNGQLGEVLILPPAMAAAKAHGGHALYEGERNLPLRHPMRKVLLDTSRAYYGRVYDALSPDWKAALGNAGSSPK